MKSGVVHPGGSSSTYCVIITPGTLDLFLIDTEVAEQYSHSVFLLIYLYIYGYGCAYVYV